MEKAVAGYYDGIKNRNTDKDDIKSNLHAFQEVNFGEGEALSYVYSYENRKWSGIGLDTRKENAGEGGVEAPGYSDLDYSRFYSSNPIEVAEGLPAGVRAGDYADLWALPDQSAQSSAAGRADAPQAELIAQNLIVVSIGQKDTGLVSGTTVSVEVLVPMGRPHLILFL